MLTTADVIRLAHSRPWASKPWSAELLEAFPGRLERAVDRWQLSIERAHLEGAGLPVPEVSARPGSAEVPAVVKFDGAGSDLQQQVRVLAAAEGTGYVRVLERDAELGLVLLERLGPTLSRELRDPISQGDVIARLLEQAWQLPLQVGLPFAPDEKAMSLLAAIEQALAAPEAPVNPLSGAPSGDDSPPYRGACSRSGTGPGRVIARDSGGGARRPACIQRAASWRAVRVHRSGRLLLRTGVRRRGRSARSPAHHRPPRAEPRGRCGSAMALGSRPAPGTPTGAGRGPCGRLGLRRTRDHRTAPVGAGLHRRG